MSDKPKRKLTDDQRIEGAILHGKIGGLKQTLMAVHTEMLVRRDSLQLINIERWLTARIEVNERMLQCLRETGEIPEQPPPRTKEADAMETKHETPKTKAYIGCKLIRAVPEERAGVPGYSVLYPDGYQSWSPKETFELAYREVTRAEMDLLR